MLQETERLIENYINVTKGNFIKIGKLLKTILQEQFYKELDYNSFEDYADSNRFKEKFRMGSRHAFNLIKVYNTFGSFQLQRLQSVSIKKLIQIAYVQERTERENLLKKAPDLSFSELTDEVTQTKLCPEKPPQLNTEEEQRYKLIREWENFTNEIRRISSEFKDLYGKYIVWVKKAEKYPIQPNIVALEGLWKELKENIGKLK